MRSAKGHIQKLGENHYRVFVSDGRNPKTGKREYITEVVRGSRADAEMVKARILIQLGDTTKAKESLTLDAFFNNLYLPDAKKRLRKTTWFNYDRHYIMLVKNHLGQRHLKEITPYMVTRMINAIDGQAKKFEAFKLLRQVLNKAVKWDLLDDNPCNRVDVPKKPAYRPNVLTAKEAALYIKHFRGSKIEPAVLIAIGGGLRRSEIIALNWSDITEDGAITIDDAITTVNGSPHHDRTKTEFSNRVVHLPASITKRLNELRKGTNEPILVEDIGTRMNPDRVSHLYSEQAHKVKGAKYVPLKNLRHTSLTLALEGGTDLLAVSRRAGHSNVSITSAYYLRPHESIDIAAASSLDSMLESD